MNTDKTKKEVHPLSFKELHYTDVRFKKGIQLIVDIFNDETK